MSQRHATDVISLVFGTIFAGFTVVWLLAITLNPLDGDAWWAGPLVLVIAGGAGLVVSLRPTHTDEENQQLEDLAPDGR